MEWIRECLTNVVAIFPMANPFSTVPLLLSLSARMSIEERVKLGDRACKNAVIGLTKTAAIDYSAKGIRINAVCPGAVSTPMAEELMRRNPSVKGELIRDIPMGRLARPEEIASAVLWLCSDSASYMSGHALIVDGGFTIH